MAACGQRARFAATWREEFFEVPLPVWVIQRRAYGLRNEEYLRLKILTCMLPAL
jgi:hypothetical protein